MRAVRFHGREDLRTEDVAEPSPGPGEVKLRNAFNGICGSDLHCYFNPESLGFDFSVPHPLTGATLPQVFGHEFSGTVVELGPGVDGVGEGDRVAVWPMQSCGHCAACDIDLGTSCRTLAVTGINSPGGGMSEFTTVRADDVYVLPEDVDLFHGALVEPMATAWHAVSRGGVRAGQTALVAGAGPVGVGIWFALQEHGIDPIVVEPVADRRAVLTSLGARHVIDTEEATDVVAEVTGGRGVDVAFEAAGVGAAMAASLGALAPRGVLVVVALHEHEFGFNPIGLVFAENAIVGSLAYRPGDFRAVIAAMAAGRLDTTGWVSTVPLDDVAPVLHELRAGRGMKILVAP